MSVGSDGRCIGFSKYAANYTLDNQVCISAGTTLSKCNSLFTTTGSDLYVFLVQDDGNLGFYYCYAVFAYLSGFQCNHTSIALWSSYIYSGPAVNTTFTYGVDGDLSVTDGLFCVDSVAGSLTLYNAGPSSLSNKLWQTQCSTTNCSSSYLLSGYPSTAASPGPKAIIPSITNSPSTTIQPTATNQLQTISTTITTATTNTATNVPAIAGGIVGAVVLLALIVFAYRYYLKRQSNDNSLGSITQFAKQRVAASFFDVISSSQQQQQQPYGLHSNSSLKTNSVPLPKFEVLDMSRVYEWTAEEAAAWIFRNGGGEVGYTKAKGELFLEKIIGMKRKEKKEERITGHSLLSEKIDDIMKVVPTEKFGDKAVLRDALVELQNT
ncbi:hypothetical protein HK100_007505, partial [Physocladia obscura]